MRCTDFFFLVNSSLKKLYVPPKTLTFLGKRRFFLFWNSSPKELCIPPKTLILRATPFFCGSGTPHVRISISPPKHWFWGKRRFVLFWNSSPKKYPTQNADFFRETLFFVVVELLTYKLYIPPTTLSSRETPIFLFWNSSPKINIPPKTLFLSVKHHFFFW